MAAADGGVEGGGGWCCVFSPGPAHCLASVAGDGRIRVWDTQAGSLKHEYVPSSHLSATCSCLSWAVPRRLRQEVPQKKKRRSDKVEASDELDLLAIGTAVGSILLYSIVKGELQRKLSDGHDSKVNCVRWHQENDCLYSCSDDKHIVEWSVPTGKVKCKWKAERGSVTYLCLSPDGKMLLSAGCGITLWNLETKEVYRKFTGHATAVSSLTFATIRPSNDSQPSDGITGLYFLSGAVHDRLLNVWQVRSDGKDKNAVLSFILTDEPVYVDLATSGDREDPVKLAVVCRDGQMHLFEHVLNGYCKKPLLPTCTLQIATSGKGNDVKPIPILAATFCSDSQSVLIAYNNLLHPIIERVTLNTKESHICLVRDIQMTMSLSVEDAVRKVKTPIVTPKAKVLVPGIPGHDASIKSSLMESRKTEAKRKSTGNEHSIEERLSVMDIQTKKGKGHLPQSDSYAVLLVQGLESNDVSILNKVLQTNKDSLIKSTIARLPVTAVVPLLHEITRRLQGRPCSAILMVQWLKAVFIQHASFLSSLPDLVPQLGALYQLMETRVKNLPKLSRLHGKLFLLSAQIAAAQRVQDVSTVNQTAKIVYAEESSEDLSEEENSDELMEDEESDVNWDEEEAEEEEEENVADPKMQIDKEVSEDSGEDFPTENESEEE